MMALLMTGPRLFSSKVNACCSAMHVAAAVSTAVLALGLGKEV